MLQSASEFTTAVQALFATQEQSITANSLASGDHLCFVGSGREEEDQYTFMVVAHFLQRHSQYVSICRGGYIGESGSLCYLSMTRATHSIPQLEGLGSAVSFSSGVWGALTDDTFQSKLNLF